MKVVIIGGVAGGMSAATRFRRLDENAEIVVLEKGPYVSFANCGLPYYISGEISDRSQLVVQTPEKLRQRFNLDVRPNHEVLQILPAEHEVVVSHAGQRLHESYDKLILSPGAEPIMPDLPGVTAADNVYALRNIPDLNRIMDGIQTKSVQHVLVVGGGFIGLEVAENLKLSGLAVTVVEQAPHVLPPLDTEMAAFVRAELKRNGVDVIAGHALASLASNGQTAILTDGTRLQTDLTIMAVGVRPASRLAQTAGLKLGLNAGIVVDEHYQTSDPDIYAVGDAIVVKQQLTGQPALIPLASPANRQGRQVADNLAGLNHPNRGSLGTAIVRVFQLAAAATGFSEYQADQLGLTYQVVHVRGESHAGYFPGGTPMTLKLVFNPKTGQIYGAQGVGEQGVDKRIDILATAIKGGLTIEDLPELELTYAPPFGSAKDPVNMLGYAAMNVAEGISHTIQWYELPAALAAGRQLLDVRDPDELPAGQFKDSLNIPLNQLRERLSELDVQQPYVVSCFSGQRSYIAERLLRQRGFNVVNLDGAFALYHAIRPQDLV
ncbi:FAD-dependent oxidoreductase [Levilactobacillus tujiorum]|uniref:FAD-dependent oxidoreductase n=1 Tax=Levilactobacillus tujiorum TaxID=2912243 RepID=A0ABX1L672_9LACO|nr:FAD-dependent oxidoreductase [Levilactobacillus tujiorum]MCH5465507.1 FAD-dependent oxidoreductase [Levilactobacillus tujiorum]NLR12593.1 FAD-dependent oxidoreductase [Lactobacillus sp. HBUAS51387]NLR29796.1 FAD-dependent oxidoreductase [Levilactobacillus tujiorum]